MAGRRHARVEDFSNRRKAVSAPLKAARASARGNVEVADVRRRLYFVKAERDEMDYETVIAC